MSDDVWFCDSQRNETACGMLACRMTAEKEFSNKLVKNCYSNLFWDFEPSRWGSDPRLGWTSGSGASTARGPAWQVFRACRHHSRRPLRLAHPRPQRASDRDPARRRTQERPRQCSPPRHCSRAFQSRRHSSVDPVPTPGRSHGRAPLSQLRSGLLPPHRHVYPRPCQRNQKKVKHDWYGGRVGCSFVDYIGKVQVSGQRWKEEVVYMAPGLVSVKCNKQDQKQ